MMRKMIMALALIIAFLMSWQMALAELPNPEIPDVGAYGSVANLDIDLQAYFDAVGSEFPTLKIFGGNLYVDDSEHAYVSSHYRFQGSLDWSVSATREDQVKAKTNMWMVTFDMGWKEDWRPSAGARLTLAVIDEQGARIEATWNVVDEILVSLRVISPVDIVEGYNSLHAVRDEEMGLRVVMLMRLDAPQEDDSQPVIVSASYDKDGLLTKYYYRAYIDSDYATAYYKMENGEVYAEGLLTETYPDLFPPLEIIVD